jgi:CHAT domain-containing protein
MSSRRRCRVRNLKQEYLRCAGARALEFVALMLLAAVTTACSRHRDPQAAFDNARDVFRHGDLVRAEKEAKKAYDDFHGSSPEWAWKFTILRARILREEGRYEDVLKLLSAEPATPTGELEVQKLRFQGMAYAFLHRFPEAEQTFRAAEKKCAASEHVACADVASARGRFEMERGNYSQAQGFFERTLTFARASGDRLWEADTLLDLAWSASSQAHFDEELDRAEAAREIGLSKGAAQIAQTALGDMGWAYYKLGDSEKAEGMFAGAASQAGKLGQVASEAGWLADAGYAFMDEGDFQKAEQSFQQSLKLAQQINSREDIMDARTALAFLSEKAGKIEDAKRNADEALAMARSYGNAEDVVYPTLVEGRIAARQNDITAAEMVFHQVEQSANAPVFIKWEAERSLARLYEDENQPDSADREYRTALSTFEAARCGLHERVDSRLPFLSNAARVYEDYIHSLVSRGKTNEALQVADYARARTLAEGLGRPCKAMFAPDPLNAPEIARRAGGTILFYALGQEHSYLWAITAHQVRLFPLTANRSEIDAAVERYRKKLEGPHEILEASNDGNVLYQMLVEPAQDLLKKELAKNGNVFIIPDSGLNSLNFETLTPETHVPETPIAETPLPRISSPQPKRYWIEDVTIVNAASLHLLQASRGNSEKLAGKLLLMGNPVAADAGPDNAYPELPNADSQMKNIEKYFQSERQEVFARQQASPAAYLNSHPEQFSYIHFVAHGTASRLNPLDSAIILSREPGSNAAASQDDSFKLYARDIINGHPLRAELVTISACYSTGNRTYSGEGLVGLSWAFLRAGAHNVIGALWDVSDASTSQLVDEFYGELKKGKSPGAALRTAKLSMLHNGPFGNPFYWAPFQLYTGS